MKLVAYAKEIAAAATPENLLADTPVYRSARMVIICCPAANTSDLLIGTSELQPVTVAKGTSLTLPQPNGAGQSSSYRLADIWVKAGTDGDDVQVMLIDAQKD